MDNEPLIIALETALINGSLSLLKGNKVIATLSGTQKSNRTENLLPSISGLLKENNYELNSIDLFAVSTGPGSFTGLRVGLATAQALAFSLERPCLKISLLDALCLTQKFKNGSNVYAAIMGQQNKIFWKQFAGAVCKSAVSKIRVTELESLIGEITPDKTSPEIAPEANFVVFERNLYQLLKMNIPEEKLDREIKLYYASDNASEIIGHTAYNIYCNDNKSLGNSNPFYEFEIQN